MPVPDAKTPIMLRASRVITPDHEISPGWLIVRDGVIAESGQGRGPDLGPAEELGGATLVPGFVDVHVHGGGGYSLTTDDRQEVEGYAAWAPSSGVTSFLATVVAGELEAGLRFCEAVASSDTSGASLLGINMEGPFLSPKRPGAIPPSWINSPDLETFERILGACGGQLRVMAMAPEVEGADVVMRAAIDAGVRVSVGHTDATYDEALRAFQSGASHVTHAFNAMRAFHHREPGPVGAALASDGVTVEVIADGVHLHPSTVRMLVRAFGLQRVALVTDATPLAGAGEGSFRIGGTEARVSGGRATLADGTIAGSVATMDEVVRNVVDWGVCNLAEAVRMASTVPADVAGAAERKGRLKAGYDADIVALDDDLRVVRSWVGGKEVADVKKR